MTQPDLSSRRLANQRLTGKSFATPLEAVERLGAVQAQDYGGAKWGLAQRVAEASDASVERALNDGSILRTHVLRPTWHFVPARDIRWMLELTAPRILALSSYYYKKSGLDDALFRRSNAAIAKALVGGNQLTRAELATVLLGAHVPADDLQRLGHFVMRAELDGVICSGGRRGKQFTYALLAERAPDARILTREEALRELATRYFATRGPATANDFAWWSGLTVADAKAAARAAGDLLATDVVDGRTYWFDRNEPAPRRAAPAVRLLPNFDELVVSYRDRSAMLGAAAGLTGAAASRAIFANVLTIGGKIAGQWSRTLGSGQVTVELRPLRALSDSERRGVRREVKRFGEFLGLPAELVAE